MKALLIYDSNFGNTKSIADEIARHLGDDVKSVSVKNFKRLDLDQVGLIILGSPIVGWKPTEATTALIKSLEGVNLEGIKFTTFDTRVKFFIHGDAKDEMARALLNRGAVLVVEPEAFYVRGKEGPLFKDELDKAADWAKLIMSRM